MIKNITLSLGPEIALNSIDLVAYVRNELKVSPESSIEIFKKKQSIDARKPSIKVNIELDVYIDEPIPDNKIEVYSYPNVSKSKQAIVVGAGPAGLFAALRLIELGVKPIVIERGKDVRSRRRDIAAINKAQIVNPESNYCFGEGGAGTYSDGKLYTRSKKRGDIRRILEILVAHGATEEILVDAHPHIGTNKLPAVVAELRERILASGGEILFDTKVVDFVLKEEEIIGVRTADEKEILGEGVILATGHSARDVFELLHKRNIKIEPKPFAMGVRIEHSQAFVDACQYHNADRGLLPAASYALVAQTYFEGIQRGVFSFCMCPGGFIVPSSTEQKELVVNGMSPSRRDSKFANSGVVVAINPVDWKNFEHFGDLAALEYQKHIEQTAYVKVMEKLALDTEKEFTQVMPAQRVSDFLKHRVSKSLNETSYQPGLVSMDFFDVLPPNIANPLAEALQVFGKKMRKYDSDGGQMIGIESRTSSPVRIPREKETFEHVSTKRLYPCGEGAGYAGGIVSAAMDGERCAEALVAKYIN
jgi:uncharacterized protein